MSEGAKENNCHTTGEKQHRNNSLKIQKSRDFHTAATRVNTEEQEHLDVPLVVVIFPDNRMKRDVYRLRNNTVQKKTQIVKPEPRLSTALQNDDSADDRGKGSSLIMGHRCNIEQKDTHCNSDEAHVGVPPSSSHRASDGHGISSSFCSLVESMVSSKLLPGSTLVSDSGVFRRNDRRNPYACGYCGNSYRWTKDVYRHIKQKHREKHVAIHMQEKPFSCDQCGVRFRLKSDLCRHNFLHTEERVFPCKICNKSYASKCNLFGHNEVHKEDEYREGVTCNQKDDDKDKGSSLILGHRFNIEQKDTNCNSDEAARAVPPSSSSWAADEHGKSSSLCSHVKSMVSSKLPPGSTLLSNRGAFHTSGREKPYACGYCGKNYKWKKGVNSHIMEKHEEKHVMINMQEKPFTCDQCGMPFRLKSDLYRHKLMHTEERVFPCKICNKSYASKCDIFGHSEVHKEAEYREGVICDICRKEFRHHHNLKEHMTTHADEKPFKCSLCGEHFRLEIHLLLHMIFHKETRNLLLGEALDIEKSKIKVPLQLATSQGIKPFNQHNSRKEQKIIQVCILPSINCTTLVEQLPDYRGLMESNIHPFQLQTKPNPLAPSGSATSDPYSPLGCTNNLLVSALKSSSENVHNKDAICNICRKEFSYLHNLKEHMMTHTGEKPFKCSLCDKNFRLELHLLRHMITHKEMKNLLLGEAPDPEKSKIKVPVQLTTSQGIKKCGLLVSDALKRSSENVYNNAVSDSMQVVILGEPQTSNTMKTKSSQTNGKGYLTETANTKQISLASGIVYEDEVSYPEGSRCSSTAQTLVISNNSEAAEEVPAPSSRQAKNNQGKSSLGFSHVESVVFSKLPPGSTLVSDRGVFHIKDIEKPFGCGYCGKTFKKKRTVYTHILCTHDEKRYSCEVCGKRYALQCEVDNHVAVHKQEKPFACDQCGMQFRFRGNLRRHKFTHSEERPFSCKICNKSFKFSSVLSRHSEVHNKEQRRKDLVCNICKISFGHACLLKLHMMIHTGEKPFKCLFCDKHFRLKVQLQYHMNTHSGKKRFASIACSVCGKTIGASYMPTHMRMHTGEKPFECSICGKRFPKKENLEGHLRSHTGEKPFACSSCDKRFALYSNMMTHKAKCKKTSDYNVT